MNATHRGEEGTVTLYVLTIVTVLTIIVGTVLRTVQDAHVNTYRSAGWEESLLSAESGVDLGIAELRKYINSPKTAWQTPWNATITKGVISASGQFTTTH